MAMRCALASGGGMTYQRCASLVTLFVLKNQATSVNECRAWPSCDACHKINLFWQMQCKLMIKLYHISKVPVLITRYVGLS